VVQARLRKTRFRDVDHDESIGMARRDARGTVKGARRDVNDMLVVVGSIFAGYEILL
jgi:hypothetical protein